MSTMTMKDDRLTDHNSDEYELTGLKNVQHEDDDANNEDHNDDESVPQDMLEPSYKYPSESNMNREETELFLVRLVNCVKTFPDLFESSFYTNSVRCSKRRQNDLWNRVRDELMWHGITPVDVLWKDLLDQYSRRVATVKDEENTSMLSDRLYEAMSFMRPYVAGKLKRSASIHTSPASSSIDYNEIPQNITDDVMISGCRPIVSHSDSGYVVVQSQRTRSATISSQSMVSDVATSSSQPVRYGSVGQVSSGGSRRQLVSNSPQSLQYSNKRGADSQILHVIKKDENNGSVGGTMTMMVDMTTYYQNVNGQKMYRLLSVPSGSQPQQSQSQQAQIVRNVQNRNSNSTIEYDLPPEPLIEGSPTTPTDQPPRKKMNIQGSSHFRASVSGNRVEDNTIVAGGVPIGDNEIIDDGVRESTIVIDPDGHLHEESPLLSASPDVMISGQSTRISQPQLSSSSGGHLDQMPSTSGGSIHHHQQHQSQQHHHQSLDTQDDLLNQQSQYDADLQFQQLISSHLSRLNDDDKALMKYNMQKILLDARFGEGTAKQLLVEEDILDSDDVHGELESSVTADETQIQ